MVYKIKFFFQDVLCRSFGANHCSRTLNFYLTYFFCIIFSENLRFAYFLTKISCKIACGLIVDLQYVEANLNKNMIYRPKAHPLKVLMLSSSKIVWGSLLAKFLGPPKIHVIRNLCKWEANLRRLKI